MSKETTLSAKPDFSDCNKRYRILEEKIKQCSAVLRPKYKVMAQGF